MNRFTKGIAKAMIAATLHVYCCFWNVDKIPLVHAEMAATSWQPLGAPGFTPGSASYTSLTLDGQGTPYIAYQDQANSYKASVMKYSNGSWQQVGTPGFSAGTVEKPTVVIDGQGTPFVALSG